MDTQTADLHLSARSENGLADPLEGARPASEEEESYATLCLGACHEVAVDESPALRVERFPVSLVNHWSVAPRDEDSAWCRSSCKGNVHYCANGPVEMSPNDDPSDGDGVLIAHYAARMAAGDKFPPLVLIDNRDFCDSRSPAWLVEDGFHRISAAKIAGIEHLSAIVFRALDY